MKKMIWLITDVDVEFDRVRFNGKETKYRGNLGLTKGIPELLDCLNRHEIHATFHLQEQNDPDLSILMKYPEVYDWIKENNHEISLHVHVKEADYKTRKFEIEAGFQRMKNHGFKPSAFRAGWYFTNENTIRVLEELGIRYDCSPLKNSVVGPMRFYDIPDSPYHPDPQNITKVGSAKPLIIPITSSRLGIAIHENKPYESKLMEMGVRILISKSKEIRQPVIIYFTTHSWKFIELNGSFRRWVLKRLEHFFNFLKNYDFESLKVSEAGKRWEKGDYKPYHLDIPDLVGSYRSVFNPLRHFRLVKHVLSRAYTLKYMITGKV
jgi:hypothetical protein